MTDREPPKQLVRDLLREQWTASNTFGHTPNIKYGWFDTYSEPMVLVMNPDENPLGGGETGYSYMSGSGGGPGREVTGTVTLHAVARTGDDLEGLASTRHGNEYLWGADASNDGSLNDHGVVREIERVIGANEVTPSNPVTGNQPVRFLGLGASTPVPEGDSVGPLFHHSLEVNYLYGDD